jgi:two-component system, cell cycle response regulator
MGGGNERKSPETSASPSSPDGLPRIWQDEPEPTRTAITGAPPAREPAARPTRRPALLVITGKAAGRILLLESPKVTVGRSRKATFTLSDEGVSRMHCGIAFEGASCFVTDLGSTHGTFVNGAGVERAELRPGDRIQVGPDALLQFDIYDDAEEGLACKLYEGATRDLLTRALNRRAFEERLGAEVAYSVRHSAKLTAIAVAIDHLAAVIDVHGQIAGDTVLCAVAKTIAVALRGEDVLARIGGAGFVVLGRGLTLRNGVKLAERMRKLVDDSVVDIDGRRLRVTISAGVSELGETGARGHDAGEDLLRLAGSRLATSVESGSSGVRSRD